VVSGCLAQRYAAQLADEMPEVDLFVGVGRHDRIVDLLGAARISVGDPTDWVVDTRNRIPSTPPWSAFVKISEATIAVPTASFRRSAGHGAGRCAYRRGNGALGSAGWLNSISLRDIAAYGADLGEEVCWLLSRSGQTDMPWIRLLPPSGHIMTNS
jgi:ribosomal protein S12 methylthiotransferase